ncbi:MULTISPECIES: single-stranded DNA-binding protein [unclassified Xanthomonas]|uniref:single-stranded DNA-binding protein n=1 Tax=unclassified Xanthomonas TaxID=2643310 RepID=UPI002882DE10|nr:MULTISPECIES: single-stranded DNA-binding protein [unclassified Xanthomonas]
MNRGFQSVIVTGTIGADPTIRAMAGGKLVAELSIPVTETYTDRSGERCEHTEWFAIKLFGAAAETAERQLRKGRMITIQGRKHTERWSDDGRPRSKVFVHVNAAGLTLHAEREHAQTKPEHQGRAAAKAPAFPGEEERGDDLPF